MLNFSIAIIAKNEEKTLPKLLESIKEVDDVVLVDTGSTDKTIEIARSYGVRVFEKNFNIVIDENTKNEIDKIIGENNIKIGDIVFNFAEARNWIAEQTKNDMVFMPDCDEVIDWRIPEIERIIKDGVDKLSYAFVYSFDSNGNPLAQFMTSKFYNKKRVKWRGIAHEALFSEDKLKEVWTNMIYVRHYQNKETDRSQYLKGLIIDYIQNPKNDRVCHYLAREVMGNGKTKEAIELFKKHIEISDWKTEQGQSYIFMGDCYRILGNELEAEKCYSLAFAYDMTRREPLMSWAQIYLDKKNWIYAERLLRLALLIPMTSYYFVFAPFYNDLPYYLLSKCLFEQDKKSESLEMLKIAIEINPNDEDYKKNLRLFDKIDNN